VAALIERGPVLRSTRRFIAGCTRLRLRIRFRSDEAQSSSSHLPNLLTAKDAKDAKETVLVPPDVA
jgi:hypothetical protein